MIWDLCAVLKSGLNCDLRPLWVWLELWSETCVHCWSLAWTVIWDLCDSGLNCDLRPMCSVGGWLEIWYLRPLCSVGVWLELWSETSVQCWSLAWTVIWDLCESGFNYDLRHLCSVGVWLELWSETFVHYWSLVWIMMIWDLSAVLESGLTYLKHGDK